MISGAIGGQSGTARNRLAPLEPFILASQGMPYKWSAELLMILQTGGSGGKGLTQITRALRDLPSVLPTCGEGWVRWWQFPAVANLHASLLLS